MTKAENLKYGIIEQAALNYMNEQERNYKDEGMNRTDESTLDYYIVGYFYEIAQNAIKQQLPLKPIFNEGFFECDACGGKIMRTYDFLPPLRAKHRLGKVGGRNT